MEKPDFEKLAIERLKSILAKWSLGDTGKLIALDALKGAMIYVWTEHVEPLQAKVKELEEEKETLEIELEKKKEDALEHQMKFLNKSKQFNDLYEQNQKLREALLLANDYFDYEHPQTKARTISVVKQALNQPNQKEG